MQKGVQALLWTKQQQCNKIIALDNYILSYDEGRKWIFNFNVMIIWYFKMRFRSLRSMDSRINKNAMSLASIEPEVVKKTL